MTKVHFILRLAVAGAFSGLLASCASGYASFYTPVSGATPELIAADRAAPPPSQPLVEHSAPLRTDAEVEVAMGTYAKRGYAMIGWSSFNSGRAESDAGAIRQAQAVGADLVLVFTPEYTGSVTSQIPLTTPTTSTSYTTGSATAYGAGGSVTAYGNATTTTHGSQTTYIPMTVHRSDYGAAYFFKPRFRFGVYVRNLSDDERQEFQTNQGVVVRTVVDDTPAFKADILAGDYISALDGETVANEEAFSRMTKAKAGQLVSVAITRRGNKLEKVIRLN